MLSALWRLQSAPQHLVLGSSREEHSVCLLFKHCTCPKTKAVSLAFPNEQSESCSISTENQNVDYELRGNFLALKTARKRHRTPEDSNIIKVALEQSPQHFAQNHEASINISGRSVWILYHVEGSAGVMRRQLNEPHTYLSHTTILICQNSLKTQFLLWTNETLNCIRGCYKELQGCSAPWCICWDYLLAVRFFDDDNDLAAMVTPTRQVHMIQSFLYKR
jgi:hypothetical protein